MPIRRERLQILEAKRTHNDGATNDEEVSSISEREDRTDKRENNYMLEVSKSPHAWAHKEWRELEIDGVYELNVSQGCVGQERSRDPGGSYDTVAQHPTFLA